MLGLGFSCSEVFRVRVSIWLYEHGYENGPDMDMDTGIVVGTLFGSQRYPRQQASFHANGKYVFHISALLLALRLTTPAHTSMDRTEKSTFALPICSHLTPYLIRMRSNSNWSVDA